LSLLGLGFLLLNVLNNLIVNIVLGAFVVIRLAVALIIVGFFAYVTCYNLTCLALLLLTLGLINDLISGFFLAKL
jgi:hypothetical protein